MTMRYLVTAGAVTVETAANDRGSRAHIDIFRGSELPNDVPQEQVDRLLALRHIAEQAEQREKSTAQPEPSKDELLELAESEGIEVDGRWSAKRIAKTIDESRS